MNCFHPNIILLQANGIKKKDGTPGYKTRFIPYGSKGYEGIFKEAKDIKSRNLTINGEECKIILAPCNRCQGCKTNRRQEWATRLELESRYYKNNLFITLTYDPAKLIIPKYWAKSDTGEIIYNPGWWTGTLSKYHAERFIRSLKEHFRIKYNHTGVKYYLCGEYGSSKHTSRPHYHAIILNCPEINMTYIGKNSVGDHYYKSTEIEKIWNKGFITIGKATWNSMQYVAGYVNKKMYGKKALEDYDKAGKIPEFALMSNGIGKKYLEEHKEDIYENDEIINSKGKSIKPPKYFDRLTKETDPDLIKSVTEKREEIAAYETEKILKNTSKNYKEHLETQEVYTEDKQTAYNRNRLNESLFR